LQKLHLVGFTTDHEALIFSARKGARSGGFVVPLDADLVATINDILRLRGGSPDPPVLVDPTTTTTKARRHTAPSSSLTPREIQARIRAGKTIAGVADEAGVDEEWVERFAVPIIAEQQRVVDRVRGLLYTKPRLGLSSQPLGVAVEWNLRDKGVTLAEDDFERAWSAFQQRDGSWTIRFAYTSRTRKQVAEWELDVDGELLPRNRLASELAYVEPGRRRRRARVIGEPVREPSPARKSAPRRKKATTRRAPARKAAARKTAPAKRKAATRKKVATKKKAPAAKAARKKSARPSVAAPSKARGSTVAVRRSPGQSAGRRPRPLRAR